MAGWVLGRTYSGGSALGGDCCHMEMLGAVLRQDWVLIGAGVFELGSACGQYLIQRVVAAHDLPHAGCMTPIRVSPSAA